jgi:murein DD-endopeptidase MepM/ murein hydrolase activator NlpD
VVAEFTVTGREEGAGETETQKTAATAILGAPPLSGQPYGFPASGRVTALDATYLYGSRPHRGTLFTSNGTRYFVTGGMDIVGPGGTPVYSTVEGIVIYSGFDYGDNNLPESKCSWSVLPGELPAGFGRCGVGGAVIIQSADSNYTVSFIHLGKDNLKSRGSVRRGDLLGYTYDGPLPTSTNTHLHYQILYRGGNSFFGQAKKGSCPAGAILPSEVSLGDFVEADTACD